MDQQFPPSDHPTDPASLAPTPAEPATPRPPRHDVWTRAKMAAFLRELAASQSVSHAAKSVGLSRQSAYKLRNRLAGTPFALAWEVALEAGLQQLAHAVMERALNGEEVAHYHRGEKVGSHRKYDNRLAVWLLSNPWKVGRNQVAREYSATDWDQLLDRVEFEPLGWEPDEPLPGRIQAFPPPVAGAAQPETMDEKIEARAKVRTYDHDNFIRERSWYVADATYEAQKRRGGRR